MKKVPPMDGNCTKRYNAKGNENDLPRNGRVDKWSANPYNHSIITPERVHNIMSEQAAAVQLEALADKVRETYEEFTQSVMDLGNKAKGRAGTSKMAGSFMRWLGGSHITTPRDQLCEEFLTKVQSQLEFFTVCLEGATEEEAASACAILADVMLAPAPARSNATTDLMKRAMASQFKPFLDYLTREKLRQCLDRMNAAYKRREMFPVEKELVREMERRLA